MNLYLSKKHYFILFFLVFVLNINTVSAATSPIGFWKLDEGNGTLTANSTNSASSNGALINGPSWTSGKLGNALSFDGVDDQIKINDSALNGLTTMTISVWINPRSGGEGRILSKGGLSTGSRRFLIQMGPDNSSIAFVASYTLGQGGWVTPAGSISLNTWHHVLVTYTYGDVSNTPSIYIDGVLQSLSMPLKPSGGPIADDDTFYIGSRGIDNAKVFNGIIDQVRVYNSILNTSEISVLYNEVNPQVNTKTLSVSGNQILNDGQPFKIKGVQIVALVVPSPTLDISPQFWYFKDAYQNVILKTGGLDKMITAAKSWGVNTIRFQLSQPGLDPQDSSLTPAQHSEYISEVNQALTKVTDSGLFVIASMQDEWDTVVKPMPSDGTWRALQSLLPLFKDNQYVIFDVFNEPRIRENDNTNSTMQDWNIWKNGGSIVDSQGKTYQALGMQTLVNLLRQAGSKNALLVEVLDLGLEKITTEPSHLVSDSLGKIIYSFHYGKITNLTVGSNFSLATNTSVWDNLYGDAAKIVPIVNGEWNMAQYVGGTTWRRPACENIPQIANFELAYFQKNIAGIVGFSFDLPPYTITKDWNYSPSTYATNASLCSAVPQPDVLNPLGDAGSILYSWFHDGTDLWSKMEPSGSIIKIGSSIKTTSKVNIRETPSSRIIGTQPLGSIGVIISGPTTSNGIIRWNIDYTTGVDGWTAEQYLILNSLASTKIVNSLSMGSTGQEVTLLQSVLHKLGYFSNEVTGYFGSITQRAVKNFQTANVLEAVGVVGPKTKELLNNLNQ